MPSSLFHDFDIKVQSKYVFSSSSSLKSNQIDQKKYIYERNMSIYFSIFCLILANVESAIANCNGHCGEGEGDCDTNSDCLPGFRCKHDGNWFGLGVDYCTKDKCYGESDCCKGQCGEGEGDCDYNGDCLPGFECKYDWTWDLFSENDYCTEEFREWKCDAFPEWLQKSYRIRGVNFCKEQWNANFFWNDESFNSQPKCNNKVLPTISFYDAIENQLLCILDMNMMNDANGLTESRNEVVSKLINDPEVWVTFIVHGFSGAKGAQAGWYQGYRTAIGERYGMPNRKVIVGEVVWKEGSNAIFDSASSRKEFDFSFEHEANDSETEDRAYTEALFDAFLCTSYGIGSADISGYSTAASNTMIVGHALGKLAESLYAADSNGALKVFCIGHSLGSHVCGFAGKTQTLDGIIGLDPAGPIFQDNFIDGRLSKEDAKFVQTIHVDAGELGIDQAIGHQNIFINGGKNQPGCRGALSEALCSHSPFAYNFLLHMIKQDPENDLCYAKVKCAHEAEAMEGNQESCIALLGVNIEVGGLMSTITDDNSGIFHLNTERNESDPCYFTIESLEENAYGYNDFLKGINSLFDTFIPQILG